MSGWASYLDRIDDECFYGDLSLSDFLSIQEVAQMWDKKPTAVRWQIKKGAFKARKLFSGGGYIISRHSVVSVWGKPVQNTIMDLWKGSYV